MADRRPSERELADDLAGEPANGPEATLDLRDSEPLVDLRDAPSVRFEAPAGLERRDAFQQARLTAVIVIAVLNALDLVTTYVAISLGAHEGNPVVAWMIASRMVVVAKVLICGTLIFGAVVARDRKRRVTLTGLCTAWAVVGVYSLVVLINSLTVWMHLR